MQHCITERKVLTVSDLNRSVKLLLETHYKIIWVEGEVSNLSKPNSGHLYFTLKDQSAQVRCALFRTRNYSLPFALENGMHILACARISLYEGRGDYQLIVEHLEEQGEGLLRRRFEILKNKLAAEGLFNPTAKKSLPQFPKRIGVVTSPTGAAIKDVLSVLKRRFASIPIIIYPAAVQGEAAPLQIAAAIKLAELRNECDVLLICRGGGSLEDLWSFNEEIVARAIFRCPIPTISGIGHEIDFTIADFVVDYRAPTPSAAAELLSPDKKGYCQHLSALSYRLGQHILNQINHKKIAVENYQRRIQHPKQMLLQLSQTVDFIEISLKKNIILKLENEKSELKLLLLKIHHANPAHYLKANLLQLKNALHLLTHHINKKLAEGKQSLFAVSRALNTVSPLNTLERGYSITTKKGHVVETIAEIKMNDEVQVEIRDGYLHCLVDRIIKK